jgi:hypothetical protein
MHRVKLNEDRGSAVLEFVGYGILLQVPLIALSVGLVSVQHDQLAAEAITIESLRSFIVENRSPSQSAADLASAYRISVDRVRVQVSCQLDDCYSDHSWIRVTTQIGSVKASAVAQR